ncbi:MAG TPA: hypothetical protein PKE58_15465, partial [Acidobacteriota bacterium]|nr:hypothetical protein [Acidobacteriota bacterium]
TPPLPVWRGDWADWWADGVGSSAYETAIARNTEALLPAVDLLATQAGDLDPALIEEAYRHLSPAEISQRIEELRMLTR